VLAATSIGAIWTGVSPDTGVAAVLDRLVQIEPVVLFADNAVEYNGKSHKSGAKTEEIILELKSLRAVIVYEMIPGLGNPVEGLHHDSAGIFEYQDFLKIYGYVASCSLHTPSNAWPALRTYQIR
jgi:acetoacetyl-CoA synthetase